MTLPLAERERLIERHEHLIGLTRQRVARNMPYHQHGEDLEATGRYALCRAANLFDPARGVRFETYCIALIRGAMLEYLRTQDWAPRLLRTQAKALAAAEDAVLATGALLTEAAVGAVLGLTLEALGNLRRAVREITVRSLAEVIFANGVLPDITLADTVPDPAPGPMLDCLDTMEREELARAVALLPVREAQIMRWRYWERVSHREIGVRLGVSESRAHQLDRQALRRLRLALEPTWA